MQNGIITSHTTVLQDGTNFRSRYFYAPTMELTPHLTDHHGFFQKTVWLLGASGNASEAYNDGSLRRSVPDHKQQLRRCPALPA